MIRSSLRLGADPGCETIGLQMVLVKNLVLGFAAVTMRQACTYLLSCRTWLPLPQYQIIHTHTHIHIFIN